MQKNLNYKKNFKKKKIDGKKKHVKMETVNFKVNKSTTTAYNLYQANKGKSEEQILNTFNDEHPGHNNPKCQLGWYKVMPVWEVTYKKKNGNYGYVLYDFRNGKEVVYADNL